MEEFKRNFEITLKPIDDDGLLIINSLKDTFHDISLRVYIDFQSTTITAVEADFNKAPTPKCKHIDSRLNELVGVKIGKGLTNKIFETTGGSRGCLNIRNMLLSSLPLALNAKIAKEADDFETLSSESEKLLSGTCIGYS